MYFCTSVVEETNLESFMKKFNSSIWIQWTDRNSNVVIHWFIWKLFQFPLLWFTLCSHFLTTQDIEASTTWEIFWKERSVTTLFDVFFLQFFLSAQTLIYDISKAAIKIKIPMFVNSQNISLRLLAGIIGVLKFRLLRQFEKVRWLTLGPCYAP